MATYRKVIPVNPLLNEKGEFVSLKHYIDKPIKPNSFAHADPGRSDYGKEYKLSYSVSTKLELAAIGGVETNMGSTTFIHDSIIYRLSRHPIENGSDIIKGTWWGYGMRLKVTVKNAQFGVQAKWLSVAAAAQLGYLDAEFEIESIGLADTELFSLLPAPTDLNLSTYKEILAAGDKIRAYAHGSDPAGVIYKPLRIIVDLPDEESFDPLADDKALIFVYQQVSDRKKLRDARQKALKSNINPELVSRFYKEVFTIVSDDEKPSRAQRDEAQDWLEA
ncbi:MAG TPA: hypothetical protein VGN63_18815 [Flavisolibacter sp.]|jgi:hypothetical protein|nr:hypothetical protein [Flavisolibacter sp.]